MQASNQHGWIWGLLAIFGMVVCAGVGTGVGFALGRQAPTPPPIPTVIRPTTIPPTPSESVTSDGKIIVRVPVDGSQYLACPPVDGSLGGTPQDLRNGFKPFWEAYGLLEENYIKDIPDNKLVQGAIEGLLSATGDPNTGYMSPEQFAIATQDSSGDLEGIGAEVEKSGDYIRIVSPMPGSPAEAAGILPGDVITKVDGQKVEQWSFYESISHVRGPQGSKVVLTILRQDEPEPLIFEIVRAKITVPMVEGKVLDNGIAYVKINQFGDKTTTELQTTLQTVMAEKPTGLVLDFRNNPGGYLTAAIEVVSQFVSQSPVMLEEFGEGKATEKYDAVPGGLATEVPLAVLINGGTASASEIVSGAIQDYQRGVLVGTESYGKGTVQSWIPLNDEQGAVRITIAHWLTPKGRWMSETPLQPDITVERTAKDREQGLDPQLDAAVEYLLSQNK